MNKDHTIELISTKIKLIRTEKRYTQDKMAEILGISKKRLFKLRKGERMQAGPTPLLFVHCLEIVKFYRMLLGMIH